MEVGPLIERIFWVLATFAIALKFIKWFRIPGNHSREFASLQRRYFVGFYSFQMAFMFSGPFVYARHIDGGMTDVDVANLKIIFNVTSAVIAILAGPILKVLGHQSVIMMSAISGVVCAACRLGSTLLRFQIAMCFMAFVVPMSGVAFEDWLLQELRKVKDCPNANFIFAENNALLSLTFAIFMSPVSDTVNKYFGSRGVFIVAIVLLLLSLILIALFFRASAEMSPNRSAGFTQLFQAVSRSHDPRFRSLIALDALHGMNEFLLYPALTSFFKSVKDLPPARLMGSMKIAVLLGTQIVNMADVGRWVGVSLLFYFCMAAGNSLLMNHTFDNKLGLYGLVGVAGLCDGGTMSLLLGLRKAVYPDDIRGHVLGMCKLMTSLGSSLMLHCTKRFDLSAQPLVIGVIQTICAVIAGVMLVSQPERLSGGEEEKGED